MLERKDISLVALPVLDHKLNLEGLNAIREGFAERMQEHAYGAICRASGYEPHPPPSSELIRNKHTFTGVKTVRLDAQHASALGRERPALEFSQPNGTSDNIMHLGLPTDEEGLADITGKEHPTFEDIVQTMCHPACIGGNIPNAGMNQIRMVDALRDIDPAIRIHFFTPNGTRIMDMLEEARHTMNGSLHVHGLDLQSIRKGLHIPVRYLHEERRSSTAMFNSAGPTVEEVRESLKPHADILHHSSVFTPDPRYEAGNGRSRLIPTSAAMPHVSLKKGQTLFVIQEELLRLCMQNGIVEPHAHEDWLPSVLRGNQLDADALHHVNQRLLKLNTIMGTGMSVHHDTEHRRMAQVGRADGAILDLFGNEQGMTALHTNVLTPEMTDRVIELSGSTRIAKHLEETTGRGDAASAAALLDELSPKLILHWWCHRRGEMHLQLTAQQEQVFRVVLPSLMSRIHAKVVHYCPDSNFFEALNAEGYKRLLDEGVSAAVSMAAQYDARQAHEPQVLHDEKTGCSTAIWHVPGTGGMEN